MTILGPFESHIIVMDQPGKVWLTVEKGNNDREPALDHVMTIDEAEELVRTLKLAIFRAKGFDQGGALAALPAG